MFVPGSAELFNMEELPDRSNPRLEDHPDVAAFFERMTYIPLAGITQMVPPGGAGVGMHVIPVEKAISMKNEAIDIEKLSYWLEKYEGKIGVGRCSCRASRKAIDDGCADDDFGWCIGVGDFADYCRETGKGHDITKEEALAILKRAEDNGFVHQITNIDGENKIFGICNCNVEICNALRTSQLFNTPNMSRSAYVAHVEKDKCVACGRCVEYCPAGAVRLGQKLCKKDVQKYNIQNKNYLMLLNGDQKNTILTIVIIIELIPMKQELLLVKVLVLHTLLFKDILKWPLKEDTKMLWL